MTYRIIWPLLCLGLLLAGCGAGSGSEPLRLATTTSTADSGLLDAILPDFERRYERPVEVIAVGTGQALALGRRRDVDVLLVHAPELERPFMEEGHGIVRQQVMYNDFVIVGPPGDPAGIRGMPSAADALVAIAAAEAPFASRGDDSGTFVREQSLWQSTGGEMPAAHLPWYHSLGQGMGETLIAANELEAYTLSDRGTFLAMQADLPDLAILVGDENAAENPDEGLRNVYSVIVVKPASNPGEPVEMANRFAEWLVDPATQDAIGEFKRDQFDQPLFYPISQLGNRLPEP